MIYSSSPIIFTKKFSRILLSLRKELHYSSYYLFCETNSYLKVIFKATFIILK